MLRADGLSTGAGTLGQSVATIFNDEFFYDGYAGQQPGGVPVNGSTSPVTAPACSATGNPKAAIAATSQAQFDVFVGRTVA